MALSTIEKNDNDNDTNNDTALYLLNPKATVKCRTKTSNLFCNTAAKRAMLHVSSLHVQTCLATNQVVASCLNTDFWLDKITLESCRTQELPQGLAAKQVCLGSVKCTTCKDFVQQLFATCINLICCKTGWFVGGKTCNTAIQLVL